MINVVDIQNRPSKQVTIESQATPGGLTSEKDVGRDTNKKKAGLIKGRCIFSLLREAVSGFLEVNRCWEVRFWYSVFLTDSNYRDEPQEKTTCVLRKSDTASTKKQKETLEKKDKIGSCSRNHYPSYCFSIIPSLVIVL